MKTNLHNFYLKNSSFLDSFVYKAKHKSARRNILSVTLAIVIALFISFIIITSTGTRSEAFFYMIPAVFSDSEFAQNLCVQMCIYAVAALAFSFCMKVGIFNIGISGQMLAGASTAFLIILGAGWKDVAGGQILTILFSVIGATFVAIITGLLKIYFRVNEVVTGILLNWIIMYIVGAIVISNDKFIDTTAQSNGQFYSKQLDTSFALTQPGNFYGWLPALIITLVAIVVIWVILKYTVYGHKLRTVGNNLDAAKNFGYNKNLLQLSAFAISGVLSGILAVLVYTASMSPKLSFSSSGAFSLNSVPSQGFDGIAIGLISLNNPLAILLVSFVFSFPDAGAGPAGLASNTIQLVMGVVMYIVAIYTVLNYFKPWRYLIAKKYGKWNSDSYKKYENNIFELSEWFTFSVKKLVKHHEEQYLSEKVKTNNKFSLLALTMIYKISWFFIKNFDSEIKLEKTKLRNEYSLKREELLKKYRRSSVNSFIDFFSNQNNKQKEKNINSWKKYNQKFSRWITNDYFSQEEQEILNLKINNICNGLGKGV